MRAEADAAVIHNDDTATTEKELSSLLTEDAREPLRSITPNSIDADGVERLEEVDEENTDMAKKGKGKKKMTKGGKKAAKPKTTALEGADAETQVLEENVVIPTEILEDARAAASSPASDATVEDLTRNQSDGMICFISENPGCTNVQNRTRAIAHRR